MASIEAQDFGASLRRQRERCGISLDQIAEQTKVSASLLAGLERGDLGRWPTGIFRRAFVRAYADAVGVDVDATLLEFLRVFPEDGGPVKPRAITGHALRLTLDAGPAASFDPRRLAGVGVDTLVVCALAGLTWATNPSAWSPAVVAVGAAVWHGAGVVAWGMSPGAWLTRRRPHALRPDVAVHAEAAPLSLGEPAPQAESAPEAAPREAIPSQTMWLSPGPSPQPPPRPRGARRDRRGGRPDRPRGTDVRM